jgi:hypothetical protein
MAAPQAAAAASGSPKKLSLTPSLVEQVQREMAGAKDATNPKVALPDYTEAAQLAKAASRSSTGAQ